MSSRRFILRLACLFSTDTLAEAVCARSSEELARIERAIFHEVLRRNDLSMEKIDSAVTAQKIAVAQESIHLLLEQWRKSARSIPSK